VSRSWHPADAGQQRTTGGASGEREGEDGTPLGALEDNSRGGGSKAVSLRQLKKAAACAEGGP